MSRLSGFPVPIRELFLVHASHVIRTRLEDPVARAVDATLALWEEHADPRMDEFIPTLEDAMERELRVTFGAGAVEGE